MTELGAINKLGAITSYDTLTIMLNAHLTRLSDDNISIHCSHVSSTLLHGFANLTVINPPPLCITLILYLNNDK